MQCILISIQRNGKSHPGKSVDVDLYQAEATVRALINQNQSDPPQDQSLPPEGPITLAAWAVLTAHSEGWRRQGLCRVPLLPAAGSNLYWPRGWHIARKI